MGYDYSEYLAKYKAGYNNDMDGNGYLDKYKDDLYNDVKAYLEKNQVMLKSVYDKLPKQPGRRPTIWAGEFQSGSKAARDLLELKRKYFRKAEADAENARKAAGWTGADHRTAPDGSTRPIGPYGDERVRANFLYSKLAGPNDYKPGNKNVADPAPADEGATDFLREMDDRIAEGFLALSEQIAALADGK